MHDGISSIGGGCDFLRNKFNLIIGCRAICASVSCHGLATASRYAADPPPNRTNRVKRKSEIARNPALLSCGIDYPQPLRLARCINNSEILHGRLLNKKCDEASLAPFVYQIISAGPGKLLNEPHI